LYNGQWTIYGNNLFKKKYTYNNSYKGAGLLFLLLILLLSIFFLVYFLFKSFKINHVIILFSTLFIILIVLNPEVFIDGTINGSIIFFNSVFPSLFLFLVIIKILIEYNGAEIYAEVLGKSICKPLRLPESCSIALVISALCGYPLGAKYSCELYEKKQIDINTLQRLLNIATNPSPLFVIGSVGTSMLNNTCLGYILILSSYISCFLISFIIPVNSAEINYNPLKPVIYNKNKIGVILKTSIDESIKTSLSVGGVIVIFSAISSILKNNAVISIVLEKIFSYLNLSEKTSYGFLIGCLEITNGCHIVSNNSKNPAAALLLIGFLLGFGGLSIMSQTYTFIYKYNISFKKYTIYKLIQGLICGVLSFSTYNVLMLVSPVYVFTSESDPYKYNNLLIVLITVLIMLTPVLFANLLRRLFHIS
jgi:sporulation integral membrane protein YlbJ